MRAALGLGSVDEALYLQRQQAELQRDFQIRQMLLQEQIEHQNRIDSIMHEQQLKAIGEHLHEFPDLQQHYQSLLLNEQLHRHEEQAIRAQMQQQEELRRRHLGLVASQSEVQHRGAAQHLHQSREASAASTAAARLRDIAADSLAGNAVKRSELEKRTFAKPDDDADVGVGRRRSRSDDSGEMERKPKAKSRRKIGSPVKKFIDPPDGPVAMDVGEDSPMKPSALDLLDFASSTSPASPAAPAGNEEGGKAFGTLEDLLAVASSEKKMDDAIDVLVDIKKNVEWSDSEQEDDLTRDFKIAVRKGETIRHPGFVSALPQLPVEPELKPGAPRKRKKKFKSLLDDDSESSRVVSKAKSEQKHAAKAAKVNDAKSQDISIIEYPYPIDTWWPSVAEVRRERKASGEPPNEDDFPDTEVLDPSSEFRANLPVIRDRLANHAEPGVLEKIPHCKIHRMLMKKRKNPSAPELVYCWQVTELYPNDIMVCCSLCGTWRHAACGGHYRPYSVRESIHTPFTSVCDRCHEEEKILREFPQSRKRIDRQRAEQIRRGLSTSAAMRQASFSKHGGTYKWPLGSVSATHIGGHTRSVHTRHDKAEKQWTDMATRLARGHYNRPKERVKVRTKELERLLVSVEDAGKLNVIIYYFIDIETQSLTNSVLCAFRGPHGPP